jgi:pimeloyl-ACP methyl ester carboxylesterase
MAYATRHPDHPAKLILCSTSAKWRLERVLDAFERIGGKEAREVARRFWEGPSDETGAEYARVCLPCYTHNPGDPHTLARTVFNFEVMYDFIARQQTRFDFLEDLKRIKCPTLVMGGEDDPITPIADSEDIAAALPRKVVQFERFAGCGHGIVKDAPERFLEVVRDFLKQ